MVDVALFPVPNSVNFPGIHCCAHVDVFRRTDLAYQGKQLANPDPRDFVVDNV